MDFAVVIGLVLCFALMVGGIIISGGSIKSFISIDSFLIVSGGTLGSALAGITIKEGIKSLGFIKGVFIPEKIDWKGTVNLFCEMAGEARRDGVLSLQNKLEQQKEPLIKTGLQLIIDGVDSEVLFMVLDTRMAMKKQFDKLGEVVFARMGALAPAFGMLGTVIGLVQVLGNLSEPEKLGPGIAQAFITTFYGIVFANMLFNPIANKIGRNNKEKSRYYEMILTGLQCIHEGDNPFMVEEKLKAYCDSDALTEEAKGGENEAPGRLQAEAT